MVDSSEMEILSDPKVLHGRENCFDVSLFPVSLQRRHEFFGKWKLQSTSIVLLWYLLIIVSYCPLFIRPFDLKWRFVQLELFCQWIIAVQKCNVHLYIYIAICCSEYWKDRLYFKRVENSKILKMRSNIFSEQLMNDCCALLISKNQNLGISQNRFEQCAKYRLARDLYHHISGSAPSTCHPFDATSVTGLSCNKNNSLRLVGHHFIFPVLRSLLFQDFRSVFAVHFAILHAYRSELTHEGCSLV